MDNFSQAIMCAFKSLQDNYLKKCSGFQEEVRDGEALFEKWKEFQGALTKSSIDKIGNVLKNTGVEVMYWDYFLDTSHRSNNDELKGMIYYYKEGSYNAFNLWETAAGRVELKEAGVPRLADVFLSSAQGEVPTYQVSTELPWLLDFREDESNEENTEDKGNFTYIRIPKSVSVSVKEIWKNKNGNSTVKDFISLVLSDKKIETISNENNIIESKDRAKSLLCYVAWLSMNWDGELPDIGLYFPGTAGYSALPDIGCAVGFKGSLNVDRLKMIALIVDHSLYYSLKPFSPALEEAAKKFKAASILSAKAAIMARNFSHNVGSHALANPNIYRKIGLDGGRTSQEEIKQRLEIFHSYMQGRLDFLARAISDQSDRPEPIFFLNDVMNGFFKQGVLLDSLVDDAGFPAERIKFCVAIENGEDAAVYAWDKDTHCFSCKNPLSDDPVVGIPGGMVGTHALYAFLENILRNAVKYGSGVESLKEDEQEKLEIYLQLYQCSGQRGGNEGVQPAWILSVWDNVSDGKKCAEIRNHINTPLIQEKKDGALKSEGHGIQEMKLCAEALAGNLRFPSDQGYESKKCKPCTSSGCDPTRDYKKHIASLANGKKGLKAGQALRCYVKKVEKKDRLVYDLLLPNPVLLGIVPLGDEINPDMPPPYVKYYKSIDELAKNGAQIGVLLDNGCSDKGTVLNRIAQLHTCLPFRLMVLTEEEKGECPWKETLKGKTLNEGVDFQWGKHIPRNRLRIHANKALWDVLKSGNPNGNEFIGCTAWEAVMLRAYDSWLRAYKTVPEGGKWNLCIGFDHGGSTNITRWETGVSAINSDDEPTCIAISVVSKGGDNTKPLLADGVTFTGDENGNNKKLHVNNGIKDSLLMFDNHKKAFGVPPDKTKFYQGMGQKEGLTLFQSLTSPPQSGLGFGLFVYSLVEGALTRVYTLDERVAEAVSDDLGKVDDDNVSAYNSANIMPLFRFDGKNKPFYISKAKDNVNNDIFKLSEPSFDDADVLLIHEGVMDLLSNDEVGIWQRERDTPKLFAHAPFVVRVSGRGRETRHLDDAISFLEFNELSGNTYQEMNKPRLVKALLGSSGSYDAACKSELIKSESGEQ